MAFSGASEWEGAFLPIVKHRDYCGVISNHIEIKRIDPATEDVIEAFNEDFENDVTYEELVSVGEEGEREWIVTVDWKHEGQTTDGLYNYRYFGPAVNNLSDEARKYLGDAADGLDEVPDPFDVAEKIHDHHSKKPENVTS